MSRIPLMKSVAIPAASTVTTTPVPISDAAYVLLLASLDWTSGGTAVKAYVQTSLDNGTTWIDIACFAFATADATKMSKVLAVASLTAVTVPTDGTLADNTVLDGVIGDQLRVKYVVTGTYVSTTLSIWAQAK
jgi:hypothetical protein